MLQYNLSKPSEVVSSELLQQHYVATTPGSAFGPAGEGSIRLAYCRPEEEIQEGIKRIGEYLRAQ